MHQYFVRSANVKWFYKDIFIIYKIVFFLKNWNKIITKIKNVYLGFLMVTTPKLTCKWRVKLAIYYSAFSIHLCLCLKNQQCWNFHFLTIATSLFIIDSPYRNACTVVVWLYTQSLNACLTGHSLSPLMNTELLLWFWINCLKCSFVFIIRNKKPNWLFNFRFCLLTLLSKFKFVL